MPNFKMGLTIQSSILSLLVVAIIAHIGKTEDIEPPFPELFNPSQAQQFRIRMTSEAFAEFGYRTYEEFADFEKGRNLVRVKQHNQLASFYSDSLMDMMYNYKPFICTATSPTEMSSGGYEGFRSAKVNLNLKEGDEYKTVEMHVFGIMAIWMNAASLPKQYSVSTIYPSTSKFNKKAHKWSLAEGSNYTYHLYFTKLDSDPNDQRLKLDTIQYERTDTKEVMLTINILSIEYYKKDAYEDLFQVPIGYGCINSQVTAKINKTLPIIETRFFEPKRRLINTRMNIEATATVHEAKGKRISDTVTYDLINAFTVYVGELQLIRRRDSKQDIKTIFNYYLNTQYKIDMRSGLCEISSMGDVNGELSDDINLSFNNNLKLNMDTTAMRLIFTTALEYFFIKKIYRGSAHLEYYYFERTTNDLFKDRGVRIVRVYSNNRMAKTLDLNLESVTIYVFDPNFETLKESYHLNILNVKEIGSISNLMKVFDVSEQCYLNNESMKQNNDFAWAELTYPVTGRYNSELASQTELVKTAIYHQGVQLFRLNIFQIPRMELVFQDTGFVVRLLLIDLPPMQTLYNLVDNTVITVDEFKRNVQELAVDLDHCANLCKLYQCKAMSFCEADHLCLLSTELPDDNKNKLIRSLNCKTYVQPKKQIGKDFKSILQLSLHQTIGAFQHRNFDSIELPVMPDELMYPRTDIDFEGFKEIKRNYINDVSEFLNENKQTLPLITFKYMLNGNVIILKPNKFELEQDPLSEFSVDSRDSLNDYNDDQDRVPAFHEGLSLHRFKIDSFKEVDQQNSRLYSGFIYDQCAVACVDSRCSSFSYCRHRQECIITDIYSFGSSTKSDILEEDSDCFIAQRDFLSKFNKFQDVHRSSFYKRSDTALNPSECAHTCIVESGFKCLAFDYCAPNQNGGRDNQLGTCFYLEERVSLIGAEDINKTSEADKKLVPSRKESGCDHYSRSYLADFIRIEYRQVKDSELQKLKTNVIQGKSVDQCADECVNEFDDCTAFQFCLDPDSKTTMQSCTLIESRPTGNAANYRVVVNETGDGKVSEAGKYFELNRNCHVFSLRKDSSEAHLRKLALNGLTSEEDADMKSITNGGDGISIGGGFVLYLCLTFVSAAITCGLLIVKDRREYIRQKIDHFRVLLRYSSH